MGKFTDVDGNERECLSLTELQQQIGEWGDRNFPNSRKPENRHHQFLGAVEEMGELSHSILKLEQGIRGTPEEHTENAKDAVADVMVYLLNMCYQYGWSLDKLLNYTWSKVQKRDWQKNKHDGGDLDAKSLPNGDYATQ